MSGIPCQVPLSLCSRPWIERELGRDGPTGEGFYHPGLKADPRALQLNEDLMTSVTFCGHLPSDFDVQFKGNLFGICSRFSHPCEAWRTLQCNVLNAPLTRSYPNKSRVSICMNQFFSHSFFPRFHSYCSGILNRNLSFCPTCFRELIEQQNLRVSDPSSGLPSFFSCSSSSKPFCLISTLRPSLCAVLPLSWSLWFVNTPEGRSHSLPGHCSCSSVSGSPVVGESCRRRNVKHCAVIKRSNKVQ